MTISWDSVECIHRNGLITHYIISYGIRPVGEINLDGNTTVYISEPDDGGSYTGSGLVPHKNYVFTVSAVNDFAIGPYAAIQTMKGALY